MIYLRAGRALGWFFALCIWLVGCGGSGSATEVDGSVSVDGGVVADGWVGDGRVIANSCTSQTAFALSHASTPLYSNFGFVHESSGRLVSIPDAVSSALTYVNYVQLSDGNTGFLPLSRALPAGSVEVGAYDAATQSAFMLVRSFVAPRALHFVRLVVSDQQVEVTDLTLINTPAFDGAYFDALYALGSGRLILMRGLFQQFSIAVSGNEANFTALATLSGDINPKSITYDRASRRLVGSGAITYDLGTFQPTFAPHVYTRNLDPPGNWTLRAMNGQAPPSVSGQSSMGVESWSVYDQTNERLLYMQREPTLNPDPFPSADVALYEASLRTNSWRKITAAFPQGINFLQSSRYPVISDQPNQKSYVRNLGGIHSFDLSPNNEGRMVLVDVGSETIRSTFPSPLAALPNGHVFAFVGGIGFAELDLATAPAKWTRLGSAINSISTLNGYLLNYSPVQQKVLLFGGVNISDNSASNRLYAIESNASGATELTTSGQKPSGRYLHSSAVVGGDLLVVGGRGISESEEFDDVWALRLSDLSWRKVATLPKKLKNALIVVRNDHSIWALAGSTHMPGSVTPRFNDVIYNVDTQSGVVSEVAQLGVSPFATQSWVNGVQIGDSVAAFFYDGANSQTRALWRLQPTEGGATWSAGDFCAPPESLTSMIGLRINSQSSAFVGRHIWTLALP